VAAIYCEDTRVTRKLLGALGVPMPELVACHAHNEQKIIDQVIGRLDVGDELALVSDAGTPAVSDPGGRRVEAVLGAGHAVVAVPGPSALAAAISITGLAHLPITFLGFPPRKPGPMERWLVEASRSPGSLVIYEAGRRIPALIAALAACMPDREVAVCRELTKRHEEVLRAPVGELLVEETRGEAVVVVGPGAAVVEEEEVLEDGAGLKRIAAVLAARWGVSKREAYNRLLGLERDVNPG